jgi:hypothetical protein
LEGAESAESAFQLTTLAWFNNPPVGGPGKVRVMFRLDLAALVAILSTTPNNRIVQVTISAALLLTLAGVFFDKPRR